MLRPRFFSAGIVSFSLVGQSLGIGPFFSALRPRSHAMSRLSQAAAAAALTRCRSLARAAADRQAAVPHSAYVQRVAALHAAAFKPLRLADASPADIAGALAAIRAARLALAEALSNPGSVRSAAAEPRQR
jgi:hypothetical protein